MSTPHCSFVVYFDRHSKVDLFLSDMRSFFQKFPLHYELVAVFEKGVSHEMNPAKENLNAFAGKETIKILENTKTLKRAQSLFQALGAANSEYLVVLDASLATPFGDQFKILQNLMTTPEMDLCCGERTSKKMSPFLEPQTDRHKVEHFFNPILKEKLKSNLNDPLCEAFGIRKKSFQEIQSTFAGSKLHGWYLSLPLKLTAKKLNMKITEIPVYDSGAAQAYPAWQERFNLLAKSVF